MPIIRSWALTRGFALHPGTRNRYEIRDTRTQHRPASRQVNDHGRVSGTHTPANAPTRPANAPPKRYSASTPPGNRSHSHTSPAQQACLGPGSTASPICEPTSTGSAELPQLRLSPLHHLNEDQPNRCDNASRLPALDEITRLKADNHQLQEHFAQHLGHRRHNRIPAPSATCLPHETQAPNHHSVQPSR